MKAKRCYAYIEYTGMRFSLKHKDWVHSRWWSKRIGEARSKIEAGKGKYSKKVDEKFKLKGDYNKYIVRWGALVIDPMHDFDPSYVVADDR